MIELNKIYNCDCRDLMKEIIGGGRPQRNDTLRGKQIYIVSPPHGYFNGRIEKREIFPTIDTGTATRRHNVLMEIDNEDNNI